MLGVAKRGFRVDDNPIDSPYFLGYMPGAYNPLFLLYLTFSRGLFVDSGGKLETYGFVCREKDIIGVLLEFNNDGNGKISFYRNGVIIFFSKIF